MKIKRRHIAMARAGGRNAFRHLRRSLEEDAFSGYVLGLHDNLIRAMVRWHRAAKGKHQ